MFLWLILDARRQAAQVRRANEVVEGKVEVAREYIARREWDAAAALLQEALSLEKATKLEMVREVVTQVEQSQESEAIAAAEKALERKDVSAATTLLERFLAAHSDARARSRAEALSKEIRWATADANASDVLARLTDTQLSDFAKKGKADFLDSVRQPLRGVFLDVLHKNLPEERALRESTRRVRQSEYLAARRAREAQRAAEREERLQRIFDGRDDGIVVLEENEEGRKVVLVGGYRRGKKEGLWAKYVENKLNTTTDYVSGLEHGYVVAYRAVLNQEEAPTMIGEVRNGKKHGYHWVLPRYKRRLRGRDTGVLDGIRVGAFDRPRVQ